MKLWAICQTVRNGYDTYDSAVVAALTEDDARRIHPGGHPWPEKGSFGYQHGTWAREPEQVTVELLGDAAPGIEAGIIVASFNAG